LFIALLLQQRVSAIQAIPKLTKNIKYAACTVVCQFRRHVLTIHIFTLGTYNWPAILQFWEILL